ncbi:hypothetical protein I7I51_03991 [Histoplasma capsulatum]|uniref:FluG domain-containing protein n=1 Tax=Ajellomyces capsulatus TaxID=5037 RepID=A0A8A1MB29_AJECA|nr:hypothetical protein I7I51_03991 [Histoplasma capsulatum]
MGVLPRKAPVERSPGYWMDMINKPSQPVKPKFEESTERTLEVTKRSFIKFVQRLEPADPRYWLENLTMNVIECFLRWYLENHNVRSLPGFQVKVRYWRMYYCSELNHGSFPYDLKRQTKSIFYVTNRQRSQHAILRKMMTATSARPGTLVCNTGYCRKEKDALCWGDIELFMVMDPDRSTCRVLLMHVKHRLNKGKRNRGRAPRYTYIERNDNLGLCVIQDILEYGLEDEVFASEYIQEPRDIWRYTEIPAHRKSVPIHIKEEKKSIPIFRRAARDKKGNWTTHPAEPLTYAQLAEDHHRECRAAGAKNTGSLYLWRKGAAAAFIDLTPELRTQVMGQSRSSIFMAYLNELVNCDTQSVFLGTPTRDALIALSTNSSLTRDPSAPQGLTREQLQRVEDDPELMKLENTRVAFREDLISEYGKISKVTDPAKRDRYRQLGNQVRAERKKLQNQIDKEAYKQYFDNVALAALEFKNRDVSIVPDEELVEDGILSLELRLALNHLTVPRHLAQRVKPEVTAQDTLSSFPTQSPTGLECPECLGDETKYPGARWFSYCNTYVLRDHLEVQHVKWMDFSKPVPCGYPHCVAFLATPMQYYHHVTTVHGTKLPKGGWAPKCKAQLAFDASLFR